MADTDFSTLPLPPHVLANLQQLGYERMTPVQAATLPLPQISPALPSGEGAMSAKDLTDLMARMRLEAGQKGDKPAG